ncbi:bifunctional 4-hydroxy-2-oxoglutarate aldolase/2-dehydro-3-deoxy-phosphogluconate aldolase [Fodinicola acaciae]|uniref:bifunctional 4-hydroxy-2-oxoglutarate aldolase/2-dehydro-3-deoxy-phosphogluconate aldolase n=1 Tax=Fodinicola acaciae TaxID=2681555 RepID=UPI0013D509B4|nr:bifunctional 4-hydroxy-2-oxoglutarate aldolase/2-dehydro-3-deoxy-phosphogluconate aldolase [Fodinicola acaciae]
MLTSRELRDLLATHRLVAIVRGTDPDAALRTVVTLVESGVPLVEVSLTTPDAAKVISAAAAELGQGVGAGTVRSVADAQLAHDCGATFVVTPGLSAGVHAALDEGLPVLAGAFTATEALQADAAGATAVKLFPAATGGPAHLKALRDPLPDLDFVPVGGIGPDVVADYFAAGALAVGVGSPLVGDAASGGDLGELKQRVKAFLSIIGG